MRSVLLAVAGLLALAAPALAAPVTPIVTPLTAPTPMPVAFGGSDLVYGHTVTAGQPIPAGTTVLAIDFDVVAGQDAELTASCPTGSGAIDQQSVPPITGGFDGPFGLAAMPVRFFNIPASGHERFYVLCLPFATSARTTTGPRRTPVRFPRAIGAAPLAKGAKLPRGAKLLVTRLTGLTDGVASMTRVACGGGRTPMLTATSTRAVGSGLLAQNIVGLRPPSGLTAGQAVTLYTICSRTRNV
jgi:hypothetical protein